MKKLLAIAIVAAFSGQAAATGSHGGGIAAAGQSLKGGNSVSAHSSSYGNGSAYNAAGASLHLQGYSNTGVSPYKGNPLGNGKVHGTQYHAGVGQNAEVGTYAISANSGNGYGSASAGAGAYGSGGVFGAAKDRYCYNKAGSMALGFTSLSVNAGSYASDNKKKPSNVVYSENNAIAGGEVAVSGYAAAGKKGAVAGDVKKVDTWASTYSDGKQGGAYAESSGGARGYGYQRTGGLNYPQ